MQEGVWEFVVSAGEWVSKSYGMPPMTGRVLGWLLICDPPEQTAAQLAEELQASAGAISQATGMLVRFKLIDRLRVRGERADRFRFRPGSWEEQLTDDGTAVARQLLARGLELVADRPAASAARLRELDAFYAWWEARSENLVEEWKQYKATVLKGTDQ